MAPKIDPKKPEPTDAEKRTRLHEILAGERSVMMFSHDGAGEIAGRPMALVHIEDDAKLFFTTNIDSEKIAELKRDPRITISIQTPHTQAVVMGAAQISQDRALIDRLWRDEWKLYFHGKDDPEIAIVTVAPEKGTYWDQSRLQGLSFMYRMLKAKLTGSEMEMQPQDAAQVNLGPGARPTQH